MVRRVSAIPRGIAERLKLSMRYQNVYSDYAGFARPPARTCCSGRSFGYCRLTIPLRREEVRPNRSQRLRILGSSLSGQRRLQAPGNQCLERQTNFDETSEAQHVNKTPIMIPTNVPTSRRIG